MKALASVPQGKSERVRDTDRQTEEGEGEELLDFAFLKLVLPGPAVKAHTG